MLTIIEKRTMSGLRKIYPDKTGKQIVSMINGSLLGQNGELLIQKDILEDIMLPDETEWAVLAEKDFDILEIKEMYAKI